MEFIQYLLGRKKMPKGKPYEGLRARIFWTRLSIPLIIILILIAGVSAINSYNQQLFFYPDYHSPNSGQWKIWNQLPNISGMTGDQIIEAFKDKPMTVTCPSGKKVHWTGIFIPEEEAGTRFGMSGFNFVSKDNSWEIFQTLTSPEAEYIKSMGKEAFESNDSYILYFRVKLSLPAPQKARIAAMESPIGVAGALCYMINHHAEMDVAGFNDSDASLLADGLSKLFIYQDGINWTIAVGNDIVADEGFPRWDANNLPPCLYLGFIQHMSGIGFVTGDVSRFTACVN